MIALLVVLGLVVAAVLVSVGIGALFGWWIGYHEGDDIDTWAPTDPRWQHVHYTRERSECGRYWVRGKRVFVPPPLQEDPKP